MDYKQENGDEVAAAVAELGFIKEKLRRAKDDAMQSWLDSRPLIDDLEKSQVELASMKGRIVKANSVIFELRAELGTTEMCMKSAKEEEQRCLSMIDELNQSQHKIQEEMERLKVKIDRKRRRRSKLKNVLRLKKQTLQTLELTFEAIRLESEAFQMSAAKANHCVDDSGKPHVMIQISQEEYDLLKERASEEISKAEWRISASLSKKLAAENSRDVAFGRLQKLHPNNGFGLRMNAGEKIEPPRGDSLELNAASSRRDKAKPPVVVDKRRLPEMFKKANNNGRGNPIKKKVTFFVRIKIFLAKKLSKYFK